MARPKRQESPPTEVTKPAIAQPISVQPAKVQTYQPRLTGQPANNDTNAWLYNKRTGRKVWMNRVQAEKMVKRNPTNFRIDG